MGDQIIQPEINRLLGDSLLVAERKHPAKLVASTAEGEFTYRELLQYAVALANALQLQGIERGDRVAIYMDNSWPAIYSLYGVILAGGVFVMINPQTKADKLAYILDDSDAKVLLTNSHLKDNFLPILKHATKLTGVFYSGETIQASAKNISIKHLDSALGNASAGNIFSTSIPTDLASLVYTSGSTGAPKGVMHTHQSMLFALNSLVEYLRLSSNDKILNILPFAFDYGLYQLLMTVHLGATLVLEKSFVFPAPVFKRMLENEVTVFPGVPTIFSMFLASHGRNKLHFPSVTRVTNTAAALPADFIPNLKDIFPNALIYKMYGLTECKRVCYLEPELIDQHPQSVGKAIPGTEVFLLSAAGEPVAPGDAGILHVRGPHIMLGYWKQEELSNKMLKGDIYPNQSILCTHDWFKMDDNGLLYFIGRSDDIIKTRGEKVSPVEVENVLHGLKGIKDAAVIGVVDETLGQSIKAFVSLEENGSLNDMQIKKWCATNLENHMVPKEIVVLPELPKSANGKIDKKQLA